VHSNAEQIETKTVLCNFDFVRLFGASLLLGGN